MFCIVLEWKLFYICFSQRQLPRKMKSCLVIIVCAGYIFWQLFLWRIYILYICQVHNSICYLIIMITQLNFNIILLYHAITLSFSLSHDFSFSVVLYVSLPFFLYISLYLSFSFFLCLSIFSSTSLGKIL